MKRYAVEVSRRKFYTVRAASAEAAGRLALEQFNGTPDSDIPVVALVMFRCPSAGEAQIAVYE